MRAVVFFLGKGEVVLFSNLRRLWFGYGQHRQLISHVVFKSSDKPGHFHGKCGFFRFTLTGREVIQFGGKNTTKKVSRLFLWVVFPLTHGCHLYYAPESSMGWKRFTGICYGCINKRREMTPEPACDTALVVCGRCPVT